MNDFGFAPLANLHILLKFSVSAVSNLNSNLKLAIFNIAVTSLQPKKKL
jgi:hypothetical protein